MKEIPLLLPSIAGGAPTEAQARQHAEEYAAGAGEGVAVDVRKVTVDVSVKGVPVPSGAFDVEDIKRALTMQSEQIRTMAERLAIAEGKPA
jgi:hypothetical protein